MRRDVLLVILGFVAVAFLGRGLELALLALVRWFDRRTSRRREE